MSTDAPIRQRNNILGTLISNNDGNTNETPLKFTFTLNYFYQGSDRIHSIECVFILFDTFSPIIHSKTPRNADETFENGLKGETFENAPFLVWTGENGDLWKRWRKKRHMRSVPVQIGASIQDGHRGKMSAHAPQICDSSVNRLRILHFHFCCWIRYVMEEVRRDLSWKRQPYLFWFGLIHAKRKQTIGILKTPPFCRVRLLTRDEHAHSFCRCVSKMEDG